MANRQKQKAGTRLKVLNAPVAKPGAITEEQRQRANQDRAIVHKIMSEPAPRWMQVGGSAGCRLKW